jgi:hypothetical protein
MSELAQAIRVAAMLPELQRQQLERVAPLLARLPIAELAQLGDAIERRSTPGDPCQTRSLRECLMIVRDEHVRVAEWHVLENRCEHKRYSVGNYNRAKHGEIGDAPTWLEAWIS